MANSDEVASLQRVADALLQATGGASATLQVSVEAGDTADAGQLGLDTPTFQNLTIAPAQFRRSRATMAEGEQSRYELLLSASAVEEQVGDLQLSSAEALFAMTNSVAFAGASFQIEAWSYSASSGGAYLYRLLLRSTPPGSLTSSTS